MPQNHCPVDCVGKAHDRNDIPTLDGLAPRLRQGPPGSRLYLACGMRLEDANVSDDFVLPNLVDHDLRRSPSSTRVEVDRFIDCSVFFLHTQVVYVKRDGELILLNV